MFYYVGYSIILDDINSGLAIIQASYRFKKLYDNKC